MRISSRRLGVYAVALLFAIVMNFTVPRLMPGTPVDAMIAQLGSRATPAAIEAIKARFGAVDAPIATQFIDYLKGLATLDLGVSVKYYPQTVVEVLGRSTLWTAFLVVTAITFSLFVGVTLGAVAAWRRGGRFDTAWPASRTSAWLSGTGLMPAARLVTREMPKTSMPAWRPAIASKAVDMPTKSAPIRLAYCTSAGVS